MRHQAVQSVKRDLQELKVADFASLALSLRDQKISSLELSISRNDKPRFTFLSARHADAIFSFSRALAWSISSGGWLQQLELGFSLSKRELQLLVHALCLSKTLKHLSFANSGLGDSNLHLMARGFRDCAPLQVLCLGGCNLTDAVAPVLASILKANLSRKIQEDWQNSLRVYREKPSHSVTRCGLRSLDLSWNNLTVASVKELCTIFRLGPSIEALDVRGNNLNLESHKLLSGVMDEWGILKFFDTTESEKGPSLGVLGKGQYAAQSRSFVTAKLLKQCGPKWKRKRQSSKKDIARNGQCRTVSGTERYSLETGRSSCLSDTKAVSQQSLCSSPAEATPFSPITPLTPSSLNLEDLSWDHDDRDTRCVTCSTSTEDLRWSTVEIPQVECYSDATSTDDLQQWSTPNKTVKLKAAKMSKTERKGVLADISRALLQLNDRLDKLVGPSGASDNLRMQLSSLI